MPSRTKKQRFRSHDGTEITYYTGGAESAPAMVFCGGLGGGVGIWRPFFERFGGRFRLLAFEYRGLYSSGRAPDPQAYSLRHHTADLLELLEHERIDAPILVGWSMGVQVGLELHRTHPDLPAGLVAIHGTAGHPLATAFESQRSEQVAPFVFGLMRALGGRLSGFAPRLADSSLVVEGFVRLCQQLRLMAPDLDRDAFRDMGEEWLGLDLGIYARIFQELGAHDASELLPDVRTPTVVISGGADRFTPLAACRALCEGLPDAVLEVIPEATHFGLIEYPERIMDVAERFLVERLGHEATPPRRRGRGSAAQPKIISA